MSKITNFEMDLSREIKSRKKKLKLWKEKDGERAKIIIKLLHGMNFSNVLDIGCGFGLCMKMLSKQCKKIIGLDINPVAKEIFPELKIKKIDLNSGKLPFKSKTFDLVICTETLEHIFYPNFILKEIKRILKDEGTAIISLPNDYNLSEKFNFLIGRKLTQHDIDSFGHHFVIGFKQAKDFVCNEFKIIDCDYQYFGGKMRYLKFLKYIKKDLVAQNLIMKVKKR